VDHDLLAAMARLGLAIVCSSALIAARWYHERRVAAAGRAAGRLPRLRASRRASRPTSRGLGRRGLADRISHPLYWLGLTTSAALAAQAIAALIARASA
jgi:hypothetical protein